jgi:MFS family permease
MNRYYKWQIVGMLWLVCCFNYADRQSIFSVFPKLKEEYGLDAVQLGLIGSAFMWLYAFVAPLAGFIGDRVARKHLILGGCLFWSAVTALTGFCAKFWQFVTVRALTGLGETFYFPASLSLISDYHGRRTRSRALALHQSGVYVGTILGGWLGAWFAERHGWRTGFYFFGAAGVVLALILFRFLREPARGAADASADQTAPAPVPAAAPSVREVLQIILSKPTAWLLMIVFLGANFVATIFLTWTPTFLVEKFDFKLIAAGLSGSVFIHLASAVSAPCGGWMADGLARKFVGGRMMVQAAGLFGGAAFVALVGLTENVATLLLAMTLFGLCKGLYDSNIWASLYDVIEPRARSTVTGVVNAVGWGGGALGPMFVGIATKYGRHASAVANMSEAIACGAVIYVLGGLLLLFIIVGRAKKDVLAAPLRSSSLSPP